MKCFCKLTNLVDIQSPRLFRRFYVRRKFPIDPEHEKTLPVFQYPTSKSDDRRVYSWGLAATGALALHAPKSSFKYNDRKKFEYTTYPTRVTFAEQNIVTNIACGYGFTIFSVKKDDVKLFGTGLNTDSQLGYHDPRENHPLETLLLPAPMRLGFKKSDTQIIDISAGRAHVVVLTDQEGIFTLGNNSYGQCGRRIVENEDYKKLCTVHQIKHIYGEKIVKVKCGQDHSMFISEQGKVYACGWGSDGQLGNGSYKTQHKISQVIGDIEGEKIVDISCAADCVLALSDKGEVFGWGNTEYGQLNSNDATEQQLNISKAVTVCKSLGKITGIASAGSNCMVLNERGELFSWGFGILGRGPEVRQSYEPLQIHPKLFVNDFLEDSKVVKISCGLNHSTAINSKGELFTWGRNKYGCLGLGHEKDQHFPIRASVGAQVMKVDCGVDHTVALCKPFV